MRKNIKRMIAIAQEVEDPENKLQRLFDLWCKTTDGTKSAQIEEAFNLRFRQLCDRPED